LNGRPLMYPSTENLRCWAEIDLSAIRHNARVAAHLAGPGAGIMAIVKANAYGHGLPEVVDALRDLVSMFGVANVDEAEVVRATLGSPTPPVFILGPALPAERPAIVAARFIPAISTVAEAAAYSSLVTGAPLPVHLAIDTGMGRMGIAEESALAVIADIANLPGLTVTGIATHLPVADEDAQYTHDQSVRFQAILSRLRPSPPQVHSLNSAALLQFPPAAGTLVRAGLMLYGASPLPEYQSRLRPALTLKTRITLVRDVPAGHGISYGRTFITPHPMRVATLAIGYADGFNRHLSNQGADVLIRGHRCALLGRVTMDQVMADVSYVSEAAIGDEAILIGSSGNAQILAGELAAKAGTIAWDIFTGIGPRVDRVYHRGV